jgi:hypothetical protein
MKHFPFGSSTAARTDICQQWRAQSEGVPTKDSDFAIDGTIVHGILEAWADDKPTPQKVEGHAVTADHIALAKEMWAKVSVLFEKYQIGEYAPEVMTFTADDVGGTLDLVGMSHNYELILIDYKTGAGVQVDAEDNKQILFAAANILYGESCFSDLVPDVESFIGVIVQPDRAGDIKVKEWAFSIDTVNEFWDTHKANIALAREGDGALEAGEHCRFCPANGLCDATTGNLLRMQQLNPEDIEQLTWGLGMIEEVKQTIKAIEKKAYDALEIGQDIPGWKLVRGRPGNTSWDDEKAALAKLKLMTRGCKIDDVRVATLLEKKTIVSPTQAKALLKQVNCATDFLDEITHRPEPKGLTLAPASDKREAVLSADALHAALNSIR